MDNASAKLESNGILHDRWPLMRSFSGKRQELHSEKSFSSQKFNQISNVNRMYQFIVFRNLCGSLSNKRRQ